MRSETTPISIWRSMKMDSGSSTPPRRMTETSLWRGEKLQDLSICLFSCDFRDIMIFRLQHRTLTLTGQWLTTYEKLSALNAFVICGVLYVVSYERMQIDYMYNSTSLVERRVSFHIVVNKVSRKIFSNNVLD